MQKVVSYLIIFLCICCTAYTQPPFQDDINNFLHNDSVSFPPKGSILFIGSSSFTMWENLQNDFPSYRVLNRAFGGSTLEDVYRFKDQIIFPYEPKQIVIYCGENDVAAGASAEEVFARFKKLYSDIRSKLPEIPVAYVSMKPSPSRVKFMSEFKKGNKLIADFLKKDKKAIFIDVHRLMLTKEGKPKPDIFLEDELHMNEKGYAIWKAAIQPHLKK